MFEDFRRACMNMHNEKVNCALEIIEASQQVSVLLKIEIEIRLLALADKEIDWKSEITQECEVTDAEISDILAGNRNHNY